MIGEPGNARQNAIDGLLMRMREWHRSPFEHEADTEAAALIAECLSRMGAKRPTWDQGQWQYTHAREDCYRCGSAIDPDDQARGFRYCSDVCAKAARQTLADQLRWDHELRRQGYWQIVVANNPVKSCPTCEKQFKSKDRDQEYCSPACLRSASASWRIVHAAGAAKRSGHPTTRRCFARRSAPRLTASTPGNRKRSRRRARVAAAYSAQHHLPRCFARRLATASRRTKDGGRRMPPTVTLW